MRWSRLGTTPSWSPSCEPCGPSRGRTSRPSSTSGPPRASRAARGSTARRWPASRERLRALPPRRPGPLGRRHRAGRDRGRHAVVVVGRRRRARTSSRARASDSRRARDAGVQRSRQRRAGTPARDRRCRQAQRTASCDAAVRRAPSAPARRARRHPASGPYATSRRPTATIERSAEIVLGAEPAEVAEDAAEVFDAVHAANGIVLSSSIRDGAGGQGEAPTSSC